MDTSFATSPNKEAVALIHGLRPVASSVFYGLLPELRARAFTVSGVEGANVLQRVRDAIAALPQGIGPDGKDYTWDTQAKEIAAELEPFLGEEGAARRAEILLRTSGFQAFSTTIWNIAQADDDTTHLQYIHGDQAKDPTPSHIALDGIVLPKDDPFWETHTGPWGHLGCVCYVRPMNEDLVAEEQSKDDQQANPEARNVLDGETLNQLHNGTLMRAGRRHDVSPPEGERAFKWHPDDLRIPIGELKLRYDPPVFDAFKLWSMNNMVAPGTTVWNWLNSKPIAQRITHSDRTRITRSTIDKTTEPDQLKPREEYERRAKLRQDSQRLFRGGQEAFGKFERLWGAPVAPEILQPLQTEWSAQAAAAAVGRKPLFHDFFGNTAVSIADSLRKSFPSSVEVRADNGQVFVYRPSALARVADPALPLWEQVKANANNGIWLGYGANRGVDSTVRVAIIGPAGKEVSGFLSPAGSPELFARERADDFTLATGKTHTAIILR